MGFLDRAKKLAEQAKERAEEALAEAKARSASAPSGSTSSPASSSSPTATDPRMGTPYVAGMLGRAGWRERGLADPAAVLPIADRDRAGVPHTTKSEVLEQPFGMGRRWSAEGRSVGLYYQLYPEHQGWAAPGGTSPFHGLEGASVARLPDGRSLLFLGSQDVGVVLELNGLDDAEQVALVRAVADQLRTA